MGGNSYAAPDIYTRITGGSGWGGLMDNQLFTQDQAQLQQQINQQVNDLNNAMNQAWTGDAANQAVSGAAPLKVATDTANESLITASNTTGAQTDAFTTAYNTVVPMQSSPPQNNVGNQIVSFFGANTDLDKQIAQYQTDSDTNVQAYSTYNEASTTNAAAMPTDYGTLPDAHPTVTLTSQSVSTSGSSGFNSSAGSASQYGTSGGSGSGTRSVGSSSGTTGRTSPSGTTTSGTTEGDLTSGDNTSSETLSDFDPNNTNLNGPNPYENSAYGPNSIYGPNGPGSEDTDKNNQYAAGGGLFGGTGGGAGGLGGSGSSGLGGAGGAGAESQGSRSGVGNGMSPGQEEAMQRAAAGASGEPGMGGSRGQGKKGEEDKDHQTAEYLQEADPDAIFGTDQLTVPPVIE